MTVRLAELDAALSRATGLGLAGVLAVLGEPLRNRPAETAIAGRRPRWPDRGGRRQPAERVLSLVPHLAERPEHGRHSHAARQHRRYDGSGSGGPRSGAPRRPAGRRPARRTARARRPHHRRHEGAESRHHARHPDHAGPGPSRGRGPPGLRRAATRAVGPFQRHRRRPGQPGPRPQPSRARRRPGRMADRRGPLRHPVPGDAAPARHPPDPASGRPGYSRARIPPCSGGPARNSVPRALR